MSLTCCYKERYQREKGVVGTQLIGERAQIILDEVRKLSLFTRSDCLKHIGSHLYKFVFFLNFRNIFLFIEIYSYQRLLQGTTSNLPLKDLKQKTTKL